MHLSQWYPFDQRSIGVVFQASTTFGRGPTAINQVDLSHIQLFADCSADLVINRFSHAEGSAKHSISL